MKARLKPSAIVTKQQREAVREFAAEQMRLNAEGNMRRTFKLLCLSLHEEFGFGQKRLCRVIDRINSLAQEHEEDEVYWAHVDRVVERLGLNFIQEDYEQVDR